MRLDTIDPEIEHVACEFDPIRTLNSVSPILILCKYVPKLKRTITGPVEIEYCIVLIQV